ncbi:MAG: hypothetical protein NT007_04690 [Candidatus Kapabacteria bacterium]|nr:hypothetical protein [Candidatus Kapabacteria bacterium]
MNIKKVVIIITITLTGALAGILYFNSSAKPIRRDIVIKARQYSYEPNRMEVNVGDTLYIKLLALDVMHGFYLEGYDIDAEIPANLSNFKVRKPSDGFNWKDTNEIVIIVTRGGKFRYRCSHTCGTMHPFMQGEMIVHPNHLFNGGVGAVIGFVFGLLWLIYKKNKKGHDNE